MTTELLQHKESTLQVYTQSKSLLFQFILSEFLISYQKVEEIEKIYERMEALLIKERFGANTQPYLAELLNKIPVLTGSQMVVTNEQSLPWTHQKGTLNKLRHYCYLLSHRVSDDTDILNLNVAVSKAFHGTLQTREVIFSLQRQLEDLAQIPNYVALYQLLDRMIDNMKRASRLILRILIQFKEDENILLFLIEHKNDFDQLYKTQFLVRILKKMFPKGVEEASKIIQQKYQKRGFVQLSDSLTNQLQHLQETSVV